MKYHISTIGLKKKFLKWKEALKSQGLKVNHGITQDGLSKSKVDPSRVSSLKVKAN